MYDQLMLAAYGVWNFHLRCVPTHHYHATTRVMNQLEFEQMKKRLGYRIIPTIGLSTHTLNIAVALEDLAKTGASILDASIRMDHQTRFRFPLFPCSFQGFKHESMIE